MCVAVHHLHVIALACTLLLLIESLYSHIPVYKQHTRFAQPQYSIQVCSHNVHTRIDYSFTLFTLYFALFFNHILQDFPELAAQASFVLLPGPHDPCILGGITLPRGKLSAYFTKGLSDKVAHLHFASNPCRLRFYTQEIVLFRDDILRKMQVKYCEIVYFLSLKYGIISHV
jgi:DNA polymerase alpha/epsilon subunit B